MSLVVESRKGVVVDKSAGIFAIAARAKAAAQQHGAAAIVDSTIGVGLDEQGRPFVIPTFIAEVRSLLDANPAAMSAYTPPAGEAGLVDAYASSVLDGVALPDGLHRRAVPTHGGTGGLTLSLLNLAGTTVVTHDPAWENYELLAKQCGRRIAGFNLQRPDRSFDLEDFERVASATARAEGRLCVVVNSPYSNPTGSTVAAAEWEGIGRVLAAQRGDKVLVLDLAYVDFGPRGRDPADLAFVGKLFEAVPDLHVVLVPSLSKSMMAYGWRAGAAILLTRSAADATEWQAVMEGTIRGSNSNETTAPQKALAAILAAPEKRAAVARERQAANEVVQRRFAVFREAAARAGLEISKPEGGYFAVVYVDDPAAVAARLEQRNVFVVPVKRPGGLRISLCSLDLGRAERIAGEIAAVL